MLMQSEKLAHYPFNAIAHNCRAHLTANHQAQPDAGLGGVPAQGKDYEIPAMMLDATLKASRKLGPTKQSAFLWPA
jgi:hypothetical protein